MCFRFKTQLLVSFHNPFTHFTFQLCSSTNLSSNMTVRDTLCLSLVIVRKIYLLTGPWCHASHWAIFYASSLKLEWAFLHIPIMKVHILQLPHETPQIYVFHLPNQNYSFFFQFIPTPYCSLAHLVLISLHCVHRWLVACSIPSTSLNFKFLRVRIIKVIILQGTID